MRVASEDNSEPWVQSLSIRIQLPLDQDSSETEASDTDSDADAEYHCKLQWTRQSRASIMALRNLPVEAPIVLFTPVLQPAGSENATSGASQRGDPFEKLGRELAKYHDNISHVPYVASIGFTETHLAFVLESDAVITVVCEPNHPLKKQSLSDQHDFAESALKAQISDVKVPEDGEFVLVQCATDDTRRPAQYAFANVIEASFYNEQTAAYLAHSILGYV